MKKIITVSLCFAVLAPSLAFAQTAPFVVTGTPPDTVERTDNPVVVKATPKRASGKVTTKKKATKKPVAKKKVTTKKKTVKKHK